MHGHFQVVAVCSTYRVYTVRLTCSARHSQEKGVVPDTCFAVCQSYQLAGQNRFRNTSYASMFLNFVHSSDSSSQGGAHQHAVCLPARPAASWAGVAVLAGLLDPQACGLGQPRPPAAGQSLAPEQSAPAVLLCQPTVRMWAMPVCQHQLRKGGCAWRVAVPSAEVS